MNYQALDEALEYIEVVEEGVNADLLKETSKFKKNYREKIKIAKKHIKANEYKEAKKAISEASKIVEDYSKFVEKANYGTVGSAVIGWFLGGLVEMGELALPLALMTVGVTGYAAGFKTENVAVLNIGYFTELEGELWGNIKSIFLLVKDIQEIAANFRRGENAEDAMNLYRVKCAQKAKAFAKQLANLNKQVDKLSKESK